MGRLLRQCHYVFNSPLTQEVAMRTAQKRFTPEELATLEAIRADIRRARDAYAQSPGPEAERDIAAADARFWSVLAELNASGGRKF